METQNIVTRYNTKTLGKTTAMLLKFIHVLWVLKKSRFALGWELWSVPSAAIMHWSNQPTEKLEGYSREIRRRTHTASHLSGRMCSAAVIKPCRCPHHSCWRTRCDGVAVLHQKCTRARTANFSKKTRWLSKIGWGAFHGINTNVDMGILKKIVSLCLALWCPLFFMFILEEIK